MAKTFWNGEPCRARRVLITVGECPFPQGWYKRLVGKQIRAVEVTVDYGSKYPSETFYIADEDGNGWHKVTAERGGPHYGHKSLTCSRVISERSDSDLDERDCNCA